MSKAKKTSQPKSWKQVSWVKWRLGLGVAAGLLAAWLVPAALGLLGRAVVGWLGFAGVNLGVILAAMWRADTDDIRRVAASEDLPRTVGFVLVIGAATASLGAVVGLLGSLKNCPPEMRTVHLVLGVSAVVFAWLLVHLVFTLRYAHTYYDADDATGKDTGGLTFPDAQNGQQFEPNYLDFAYFSFVIGMTAQTADVGISNRGLRRAALLHGLISFVFNTAIVALTIGTIGGILS